MYFYDIDGDAIITVDTLKKEYNDAIAAGIIDNDITLSEYINNCMTYNGGTLETIRGQSCPI